MDTLERALKVWGKEAQMLQVIEEMSELTKEILKNVNRKKNNIAELIEETADVEIMLEQLKQCYQIHKQVEEYKTAKIIKIKKFINRHSIINIITEHLINMIFNILRSIIKNHIGSLIVNNAIIINSRTKIIINWLKT